MKTKSFYLMLIILALFILSCHQFSGREGKHQEDLMVTFVEHDLEKKIDVMIDGKLFTSYRWHDDIFLNIKKPVLYPVMTSSGIEITRGYPLNPKPNERTDHPHQIGVCFNYGYVNGYDFWNNSTAIPLSRKSGYGTIKHMGVEKLSDGFGQGLMITNESWVIPTGEELLAEKTEYYFIAKGSTRIIDRITSLTATSKDVSMKDTKEGGFGIRVARQLELPSKSEVILTDAKGIPTTVKKVSNEGVSGNFRSSEGITGEAVFATRGDWVNVYGTIGDEKVSVVMVDHPNNPGYPTYWHARGYGLLLANPLGASDYTNGNNVMNFSISYGNSATFRFRLIIHSGYDLTDNEINDYAADFAKKY